MAAAEHSSFVKVLRDRSEDTQPVTAVISQRIKRSHEPAYEAWMQGISAAARQFPGHLGVTIIRPEVGICVEYVIILKFDCYVHLKGWLDSEERQRWLEKAKPFIAQSSPVEILTGLETWFTLPNRATQPTPRRYKMAILTTLAVFCVVNLINPLLLPMLTQLPRLLAGLISTYLSVLLLTYVVMPRLTKLAYRWLYAL